MHWTEEMCWIRPMASLGQHSDPTEAHQIPLGSPQVGHEATTASLIVFPSNWYWEECCLFLFLPLTFSVFSWQWKQYALQACVADSQLFWCYWLQMPLHQNNRSDEDLLFCSGPSFYFPPSAAPRCQESHGDWKCDISPHINCPLRRNISCPLTVMHRNQGFMKRRI